jgi:hypothetical protein
VLRRTDLGVPEDGGPAGARSLPGLATVREFALQQRRWNRSFYRELLKTLWLCGIGHELLRQPGLADPGGTAT